MGASQRRKGREGQAEAANLLKDRDWGIIQTSAGIKIEDIIAEDETGQRWSVEVKKCKIIDMTRFLSQAREQAAKRKMPWMCMAKIFGTASWLVMRKNERPVIWHGKEK